jgi:hypothetical protein
MERLTASEVKKFERLSKTSQLELEFELGVALQYEYAPSGIRFSAPYSQMGKRLWNAFQKELFCIICDENNLTPKEWVNDLIVGDIRNLATGIVSAITAKFDVTLGIAVPIAALIIKTGILNYCNRPQKAPKKSNVKKILQEKKRSMEELKRELNDKKKTTEKSKK